MASQHRRPSARHRVLPAALCAGIVALAGCGGGSSLASQADSICKTYNAKFNALPRPTASTLITYLDRGAALLAQGTAKLRALKPPGTKSAAYQSWLTALGQELAVIQRAETTSSPMKRIGSQWSMNVCTSGSHRKSAPITIVIVVSAVRRFYSTLCRRGLGR